MVLSSEVSRVVEAGAGAVGDIIEVRLPVSDVNEVKLPGPVLPVGIIPPPEVSRAAEVSIDPIDDVTVLLL
jgi:hypothetical protein